MKDEIFKTKGFITFFMVSNEDSCGYQAITIDLEERVANLAKYENDPNKIATIREWVEDQYVIDIYDLIDGSKFIDMVKSGSLIQSDGVIANILVDDYKSNLGIAMNNMIDGEFLVDEFTFRDICSKHNVKVNWANK